MTKKEVNKWTDQTPVEQLLTGATVLKRNPVDHSVDTRLNLSDKWCESRTAGMKGVNPASLYYPEQLWPLQCEAGTVDQTWHLPSKIIK